MDTCQSSDTLTRREAVVKLAGLLPGLCLASALGACAVPGSGPAPSRVRLTAAQSFPPDMPSVAWSLLVEEPDATLSINTARVAVVKSDQSIGYMSNLEWASRAPEMVMELLVESFKNSNRILTVGDRRSRIRPDFDLESILTAFQVTQSEGTGGVVTVGLDVSLLQRPQRRSLASNAFKQSAEVASLSEEDLVAGFDSSLRSVMSDVVDWTLRTGVGV